MAHGLLIHEEMKCNTQVFSLSVFIIIFTIACDQSYNSTIDDYEQAIEWIDNKNFNPAIKSMESKLLVSPDNERARLLASAAYAGRAGVELKDFLSLANTFNSATNSVDQQDRAVQIIYRIKAEIDDEKTNDVLNTFIKFLEALYRLEVFFQTLDYVPKINNKKNAEDVRLAVLTLNGPDSDSPIKLSEKNSLYRALLRVTLLNYDIRYTYNFSNAFSCESDISRLIEDAEDIKQQLSFTLQDVSSGTRSKKSKKQVIEYMDELNVVFDEVIFQLQSHEGQTFISVADLTEKKQRKCSP